jgi:7-alpha-hydroxysteroid dehydrogenase
MLGSIINLSSIASQATRPELLAYSMAAAAMDQMTRSLALALAPKGIRVNAVAFGSVMSASLQVALKENPGFRDEITGATPLGRIAAPAELAEAVQFLASDAAGFVTGQVLTIDGGRGLLDAVTAPAH